MLKLLFYPPTPSQPTLCHYRLPYADSEDIFPESHLSLRSQKASASPAVPYLWIAGRRSLWLRERYLLFYALTPLKRNAFPEYTSSVKVCLNPEHKKIANPRLLLHSRPIMSERNRRMQLLKGQCEPLWLDYVGTDSIPLPKAVLQT